MLALEYIKDNIACSDNLIGGFQIRITVVDIDPFRYCISNCPTGYQSVRTVDQFEVLLARFEHTAFCVSVFVSTIQKICSAFIRNTSYSVSGPKINELARCTCNEPLNGVTKRIVHTFSEILVRTVATISEVLYTVFIDAIDVYRFAIFSINGLHCASDEEAVVDRHFPLDDGIDIYLSCNIDFCSRCRVDDGLSCSTDYRSLADILNSVIICNDNRFPRNSYLRKSIVLVLVHPFAINCYEIDIKRRYSVQEKILTDTSKNAVHLFWFVPVTDVNSN